MNIKHPLKSKSFRSLSEQQGAVMITVLMLLVVITLMGLSSMKQGMLQAQIGASEVAYSSCFQAAESGLNAVYRGFQEQSITTPISMPDNFMNKATGVPQKHCLGNNGLTVMTGTTCSTGGLEAFADIKVTMLSRSANEDDKSEVGHRAHFLNDIDKGGFLLIYTDSRCEIEGMDMAVMNTQAWQHKKTTSTSSLDYTD